MVDVDERLLTWARAEGLTVIDTGRARVFRTAGQRTVAWRPAAGDRLELTLIQLRAHGRERDADRLHRLFGELTGLTVAGHELGLSLADAAATWELLEGTFLPRYLAAHRELD
ncbi:MAG: hypothetical protein H0V93_02130 [Euzebyales bacterium]|jgi:hypothetical protein|nr:hypothetical protein [Euzebyales bacterium]